MRGYRVIIISGGGNYVHGGADVWVNYWLKEIYPKMNEKVYFIIDNKTRKEFDFPYPHIFLHDSVSKIILENTDTIDILHARYNWNERLVDYIDKVNNNFVHVYPKYANKHGAGLDERWFDYVTSHANKNIWIGVDILPATEWLPNMEWIPNYYEFIWNKEFKGIQNNKIGFAARIEGRKRFGYLSGHDSIAFTSTRKGRLIDPSIRVIEFDNKFTETFYNMKSWSIFHGCYDEEPFGYSIFQAVDAGKIPIIHKKWLPWLKYKYVATNKKEFDEIYQTLINDPPHTQIEEFNKLKNELAKFSKEKWINDISRLYQL